MWILKAINALARRRLGMPPTARVRTPPDAGTVVFAALSCGLFGGRTLEAQTGAVAAPSARAWPVAQAQMAPADSLAPGERLRAVMRRYGVTPLAQPERGDPAKVRLGQALFFDPILSGNRNISCATCHLPTAASGDGLALPIGEGGAGRGRSRDLGEAALVARNSPGLYNLGNPSMTTIFWDGRLQYDPRQGVFHTPEPMLNGRSPALPAYVDPLTAALAAQAMFPPTSSDEMRGQPGENEIADAGTNVQVWQLLMARLIGDGRGPATGESGIDAYRTLFAQAFPTTEPAELTFGHAAEALAAFEADAFVATESRFDHFLRGDDAALSERERRGAALFFGAAGCASCHSGPLLTDQRFHVLAVPQVGPGKRFPGEDLGRAEVTGRADDAYAFRTPPLRNVAATGPWMHDGAYDTLEGVVRHHADPVASALAFDADAFAGSPRPSADRDAARRRARLRALAGPRAIRGVALTEEQIGDLVLFLHALTDPASLDTGRLVPLTVPSGLPVHH